MALAFRLLPGALSALVLALVIGGALGGVLSVAGHIDMAALLGDAYVLGILRFTVWQAFLSAALSVVLAIPVARALVRRQRFPGRALLIRLLGLPMVIPTIVGVLGLVAVYGRSGAINDLLAMAGTGARLDIYGLGGILIAHVFFNMPFATRLLLQGWAGIPGESFRLASQLGMTGGQIFRLIEWPMLRQIAPGVAGLVFLICFTSFSIVLVLGGGPPNATLEVAIYQALRFDFDLARVVAFGVLQVGLCALIVGAGHRLARSVPVELGLARDMPRPDLATPAGRIGDAAAIAFAALMVLLPLAAIVASGVSGDAWSASTRAPLWFAALRSLAVGLCAGLLSCLIGAGLVLTARELGVRYRRPGLATAIELGGSLILVVPPFVIGAGLFILVQPVADVFAIGLVFVVIVNALMGLPFALRILMPPAMEVHERHLRLADGLGITGLTRLRLVDWPLLRRPVGLALALTTALSLGDFGVIALFGTRHNQTLPYLLYQQMGSYRMADAATTALILVGLCLALFIVIERGIGGRGHDRA